MIIGKFEFENLPVNVVSTAITQMNRIDGQNSTTM